METMLPEGSPILTEDPILSEYPLLTVEDVEASLPKELQEPKMREPEIGHAVCQDCTFAVDRRPGWLKFLSLISILREEDLVCSAFPRKRIVNPVTGRKGYVPAEKALSNARKQIEEMVDERFPHCFQMNPTGTCPHFKRAHCKV